MGDFRAASRKSSMLLGIKTLKSFFMSDSPRPTVSIPFEILPEGKTWRVGQSYRVRLVLRQVSVGENDATYEVVDAVSMEAADSSKGKYLRSDGGMVKV